MSTLRFSVSMFVLLALVSGGCGGGDSGDELTGTPAAVSDDRIVGMWITKSGYYKHYRADGTWGIGYTAEGADTAPWVWGTYTFDGSRFTYGTHPDSDNCVGVDRESGERSGMVGVYDVSFSQDGSEQLRTVVDDPCSGRVTQTTPKLLRHQEP